MTDQTTTSSTSPEPAQEHRRREHRGMLGGIILIVLGALLLADKLMPEFAFGDYWPLLLVVIGVWMLLTKRSP